MEFSTAVRLIQKGVGNPDSPRYWADLGAGSGLFTKALGSLLPAKSTILAIDTDESSLKSIQWNHDLVALKTLRADFTQLSWPSELDGVLIANALHYVPNQSDFLSKVRAMLLPSGVILVVEYERRQPNPWVPYPIGFNKLSEIGAETDFSHTEKLEETPSVFDGSIIYSALLTK